MAEKKNNQLAFYIIAVLIPLFLIMLVEGTLRLVGAGKSVPLFIESAELPGYSQPNPNIIQRYFADPSLAPDVSPDTVFFKTDKPSDSFRIVIQGGSSAAGFPYGRFGSLQGMLEQRFKRIYPNKNIEIINTAMAAVNTYTLLDFVDEIVAIQPDLVLVYTGHNEYLGIFGAGSSVAAKGSRFATLVYMYAKDLALYQLIESLFVQPREKQEQSATLMSQVARGKNIPLDSPLYKLGLEQFEGNLSAILNKYANNNIPVFVGNLVSIEQGMQPFSSVGESTLSEENKVYQQAQQAYNNGNDYQAQQLFVKAKDLDQLRFRAPSKFNEIISRVTAEQNAQLVDVESKFRQDTTNGILGYDHLLEHVHPTKRGYFLLAEAFVDTIVDSELLEQANEYPTNLAWQEVPVSELNEAYAELKISKLMSNYPFTAEPQPEAELDVSNFIYPFLIKRLQGEPWLQLQQELIQAYAQNGNHQEAARVSGILADALPNSVKQLGVAGLLHIKSAQYPLAQFYLNKGLEIEPNNLRLLLNLAQSQFLSGSYEQSLDNLKHAQKLQPENRQVQVFIDNVQKAKLQKGMK